MIFFQEIEVGDMVRFRFGNEAERVAFFKTKADQHLAVSPIYIFLLYISQI